MGFFKGRIPARYPVAGASDQYQGRPSNGRPLESERDFSGGGAISRDDRLRQCARWTEQDKPHPGKFLYDEDDDAEDNGRIYRPLFPFRINANLSLS